MALLSIGKFANETGISQPTLRRRHADGTLIPAHISPKGTRYYSQRQVQEVINQQKGEVDNDKPVALYARVSTKAQQDDLNRQIDNLKTYAIAKGYSFELISDIGSGEDYYRKGLQSLIDGILLDKYSRIIVLYQDRLVQHGFELIEYIANAKNIQIEVIDKTVTQE